MIGNTVTGKDGKPLDGNGNALSASSYQPPEALKKLFARCAVDYQTAWQLQHRSFDEFDGVSLLDRARLDQQTFGVYVGCKYVPQHKRWRWTGRKNTTRNKIIGILAQLISAVLIPTVFATDDQNDDSRESAKAMRVLLEEYLRRANYEIKFMYAVLSALVNPATFVQVEYIEAVQRVKVRLASGEIKVEEAIDNFLSGLNLNIVPIDELMLGDFYTFEMQRQPYLVRVRRISYDEARGIYKGRYFDKDENGKEVDRFDHVRAGTTRTFMASQEGITLYDIEWTEADRNMVQVATFYYRGEDLQIDWVGGVFMGNFDPANPENVFNDNPFEHRRMTQVGEGWGSMPVYPYAKSGFEPLDPQMRFAYYKSAAAKAFWDDATLNMSEQLLIDGMHLDVMKPILISGIAKYDSNVMAPGAVAALPKEATVSPYNLGPNLAAAMSVISKENSDLESSTIPAILMGQLGARQSATAVAAAINNAKRMLSVCSLSIAQLVRDVGDLSIDCIVQNTTIGELQENLPGALGLKYQTVLARGKDKGRNVTHKIVFTDKYFGKKMTEKAKRDREWELWEQGGGSAKDATRIWEINPYEFARKNYNTFVDADEMAQKSVGAAEQRKMTAFNILTDPRVAPFTDREAVINDFAIEEYGGNDPDRYKKKGGVSADDIMASMGIKPPQGGEGPASPVEAGAGSLAH